MLVSGVQQFKKKFLAVLGLGCCTGSFLVEARVGLLSRCGGAWGLIAVAFLFEEHGLLRCTGFSSWGM